jgi:hypothetical protein
MVDSKSMRRYSDEETAAIFKAAAELQESASLPTGGALTAPSTDGMTLAQLQEIGREVGIPADLVARVADGLDRRGRATVRRFLGLPIGVGRTVSLERKLTDEEWQRLVVDLRETFDARGRLKDEGAFKQWTNGNLQALLEPTPTGHQLRLRTLKSQAYAAMAGGIATLSLSGVLLAMNLFANRVDRPGAVATIALMGAVMFAFGALMVPRWARERQQQMEDIAARLTESTAT